MIMTGDLWRKMIKLGCFYNNKYVIKIMHYIKIKYNETFLKGKDRLAFLDVCTMGIKSINYTIQRLQWVSKKGYFKIKFREIYASICLANYMIFWWTITIEL